MVRGCWIAVATLKGARFFLPAPRLAPPQFFVFGAFSVSGLVIRGRLGAGGVEADEESSNT